MNDLDKIFATLTKKIMQFASQYPQEPTLISLARNEEDAQTVASDALNFLLTDPEIQMMAIKKATNNFRRESRTKYSKPTMNTRPTFEHFLRQKTK